MLGCVGKTLEYVGKMLECAETGNDPFVINRKIRLTESVVGKRSSFLILRNDSRF